ncbi:MAG: SCP-2 sterol transfer family protein [Lachnospiraceae bacterium]|nr:hypothetical protein SAMN02910370_02319 [Lachnospiraceae bacterium XPB1003]
MKINIYYGGRGLIGDPSLTVVKMMMSVFEELNVRVDKYDLFEHKNEMTKLPQTLKDADGVILASTVEWHGCGGYMASFLDACWLYGDKEKIEKLYMAPVVMSTTYGEKEGELDLINAWLSLGGITCAGISGYAPEASELENNKQYRKLIETTAENIYRAVNKHAYSLPTSNGVVRQVSYRTLNTSYTQQETEQLSEYASDDKYVEKQKEDIRELTDFFKGKLDGGQDENHIPELFQAHFHPQDHADLKYKIVFKDGGKSLTIRVEDKDLVIGYGEAVYPDFELTMEKKVLGEITSGRKTFQGAFMEGAALTRGDFGNLRLLDKMFPFMDDLLSGVKNR